MICAGSISENMPKHGEATTKKALGSTKVVAEAGSATVKKRLPCGSLDGTRAIRQIPRRRPGNWLNHGRRLRIELAMCSDVVDITHAKNIVLPNLVVVTESPGSRSGPWSTLRHQDLNKF